ncbi:MAG: BatA domain-containing protein, partial [Frankiales bacterium]|nr:BatA domain-containing protein [Frankiales bacterium]
MSALPAGFLSPGRLWLLLVPVALVVAYVLLQRRRPAYALRFTELDLLASLVPRSAVWKRHVPAGLLLLSLVALTTAFARPT